MPSNSILDGVVYDENNKTVTMSMEQLAEIIHHTHQVGKGSGASAAAPAMAGDSATRRRAMTPGERAARDALFPDGNRMSNPSAAPAAPAKPRRPEFPNADRLGR